MEASKHSRLTDEMYSSRPTSLQTSDNLLPDQPQHIEPTIINIIANENDQTESGEEEDMINRRPGDRETLFLGMTEPPPQDQDSVTFKLQRLDKAKTYVTDKRYATQLFQLGYFSMAEVSPDEIPEDQQMERLPLIDEKTFKETGFSEYRFNDEPITTYVNFMLETYIPTDFNDHIDQMIESIPQNGRTHTKQDLETQYNSMNTAMIGLVNLLRIESKLKIITRH